MDQNNRFESIKQAECEKGEAQPVISEENQTFDSIIYVHKHC